LLVDPQGSKPDPILRFDPLARLSQPQERGFNDCQQPTHGGLVFLAFDVFLLSLSSSGKNGPVYSENRNNFAEQRMSYE